MFPFAWAEACTVDQPWELLTSEFDSSTMVLKFDDQEIVTFPSTGPWIVKTGEGATAPLGGTWRETESITDPLGTAAAAAIELIGVPALTLQVVSSIIPPPIGPPVRPEA